MANNLAESKAFSENDYVSSVFEPDVILPSQYLNDKDGGLKGGERKLMAALLADGVEAYIFQCTANITPKRSTFDAREWVETKDFSYVFSFDVVCQCLGIDADYLRLGLYRFVEAARLRREKGEGSGKVWKKIRRPRKR